MTLPERLRTQRKRQGLSQAEMAARIGVSRRSYGLYELGKTRPASDALKKISSLLHVSADWLLTGEEPTHQPTPEALPVMGLAECGIQGWYIAEAQATLTARPPDFAEKNAFAVIATGNSLIPEGIKPGFLCYCAPHTPYHAGDIVYVEDKDGNAAMKLFRDENEEWITLEGYLPPDDHGVQKPYTEQKRKSSIARMATVVYIKRRV